VILLRVRPTRDEERGGETGIIQAYKEQRTRKGAVLPRSSARISGRNMTGPRHVLVLVLGDVGRSPRMQYHSLSLLEAGHLVTLVGYDGERLIPELESALSEPDSAPSKTRPRYHGNLHLLRMKPYAPSRKGLLSRLVYYPLRLVSLFYCVIQALWVRLQKVPHTKHPVDVVLVQNPPSIPTLLMAYLYCRWQGLCRGHRPRFVIDWHNLGYSMFEYPSSISGRRAIVQKFIRGMAKCYEMRMAPLADAHLTVTRAMKRWLVENFRLCDARIQVLYDKPPLMFRPTTVDEQHELFSRLDMDIDTQWMPSNAMKREETLFTELIEMEGGSSTICLKDDRPVLLVSSTSWTPDEDFSILIDALRKLHSMITANNLVSSFPRIIVIVTGKGPQKEHYLPLLREFNGEHSHINICTMWLEAEDYPRLLGCATIGVSLHTSTSGLDLPMKVLDMFGCQVPVCAIGFDCLDELVRDGENGRVFSDADELSGQLFDLLDGYPSGDSGKTLEAYRRNIRDMERWKENWDKCAKPLLVGGYHRCKKKVI